MWRGVVVPKGVDPEIVEQIAEVFKAVLEDPDFQKDAENLGQNALYLIRGVRKAPCFRV